MTPLFLCLYGAFAPRHTYPEEESSSLWVFFE